MKSSFIFLLLLLLAAGCQMASPPPPPPAAPAPLLTWVEQLQIQAKTLPTAQVSSAPGTITIDYPQESLFSLGAVLPLVGGAEALDPLATLLSAYPEAIWDAQVEAATSNGVDYDLALAQKRSELLKRYLRNRGVANGRVIWQEKSGAGSPLTLTLRPLQPLTGSSSGVKE